MTQMSGFPLRCDSNAIWLPSGDQEGCPPDSVVTCVAVPPLAGMPQMSAFPLRWEKNAI